jgi:hypothetical protein
MLIHDPEELPGSDPLVGKKILKRELGISGDATLFRYIRDGVIPEPDGKVGQANVWRFSTVVRARESLLKAS